MVKNVKVYTTSTCPYCKMEKGYLDSKNIQYESVLVDQDPSQAQEMVQRSGQMGVPFTIVTKDDGTEVHILGFDRAQLDSALGLS